MVDGCSLRLTQYRFGINDYRFDNIKKILDRWLGSPIISLRRVVEVDDNGRIVPANGHTPSKRKPRREKLTQDFVTKLEPPASGRAIVWDTICTGFGVRVSALEPGRADARKTFIAVYRVGPVQAWKTIGTFGRITKVADARKLASDYILRAKLGIHAGPGHAYTPEVEVKPGKSEVQDQPNNPLLIVAVQEFLVACQRQGIKKRRPLGDGTITLRRLIFAQIIPRLRGPSARPEEELPDWSERPIRGITKEEIGALIEQVGSRRKLPFRGRTDDGAKGQANNTFDVFRTFFRWAKRRGYIDINPTDDLERRYPSYDRNRWLKDDEIRLLWGACAAIGYPFGPIIQLLLLTAQRESEVAGISRIELDTPHAGQWTIRRRTKTTEEGHIVPLSVLAREIIGSLPQIAGTGLLFTLDGQKPVSGFSSVKTRIDRLMLEQRRQQLHAAGGDPDDAVIEHWTFHDLRRTATTIMAQLEHDPHVVDKILNHAGSRGGSGPKGTIRGMMAVYNVYDYLRERTAALEDLGRYVNSLIQGEHRPSHPARIPTERPNAYSSQTIAASKHAAAPLIDQPRALGRGAPVAVTSSRRRVRWTPLIAEPAAQPPTAFDLVSDMHIDVWGNRRPIDWASLKTPGTRILVDAGDDADLPAHSEEFLLEARAHYDVVIAVDGNHHHYGSGMTVGKGMRRFRDFARANDIVYLDGETEYLKDDVLFIGANGWYDFCVGSPAYSPERSRAVWRDQMDAARIKFDKGPATYAWQQAGLLYEQVLEAKHRQEVKAIVVVTHTVPVHDGLEWKRDENDWNLQNGSFANSRMQTIIVDYQNSKITTWCFGHSHRSFDFTRNRIRFVNNSRGLPDEKRWHGPISIQP
jgi:integrase